MYYIYIIYIYIIYIYIKLLHIYKAFEKKRNVCGFNKLCVFFYPYILSHIIYIYI